MYIILLSTHVQDEARHGRHHLCHPEPNRIAPYLNEPTKTLPPLPASAAGRSALLSDVVFHALVALQGQLAHHDPKVVQKAAEMILDFEKTRLRHGRLVVGTAIECRPHTPQAELSEPHTEC